jgi:hypothetical protein
VPISCLEVVDEDHAVENHLRVDVETGGRVVAAVAPGHDPAARAGTDDDRSVLKRDGGGRDSLPVGRTIGGSVGIEPLRVDIDGVVSVFGPDDDGATRAVTDNARKALSAGDVAYGNPIEGPSPATSGAPTQLLFRICRPGRQGGILRHDRIVREHAMFSFDATSLSRLHVDRAKTAAGMAVDDLGIDKYLCMK